MKRAERWLHAFGHALAAHTLYAAGHQARQEAAVRLYAALGALLDADRDPSFSFLDHAVIYRALPVHGLREWNWGRRLGAVGVRRLEFTREATREGVEAFLDELARRLLGIEAGAGSARWPGIEAGAVAVVEDAPPAEPAAPDQARPGLRLGDELQAVRDAFARVGEGEPLPLEDVEAVVHALKVALHAEGELLVPLLSLRSLDDHAALHAVNTAVLAMTFSEWLGLAGGDIRAIGKAALLHDIGMARVSRRVFRSASLSSEERAGLQRHPEDGARLLLARSGRLDLAATIAYEHHLRVDGRGYPARRFHPELHYITRIIAVCSAYDALRSQRCFRPARDPESSLGEIAAGVGSAYDSGVANAFLQMMRRWEHRLVTALPD